MSPQSGVVLQGVDPPGAFEGMARRVEELGYDHLWLTDSSLHSRSCYAYLALAARETQRVTLGTAVTNPLTRHPAITAASIATIDDISAGRALLGIGAGDRPVEALGFRPARVEDMRRSVEAIRRLLAGDTVDMATERFTLDDAHLRFPARADLPVFLSASGPRMLELAGEIADGVILLAGLFEEGVRFAIERIDAGASRAGRPRPQVAVMAYGAIDEDEDRALEPARAIAAWFPQTAPAYCRLAGLDDALVTEVRERYRGGEFQEAAEAARLLPDAFVRKMAIAGNRARVTEQLSAALTWGVDAVCVFPLGEERMATVEAFASAWRQATA